MPNEAGTPSAATKLAGMDAKVKEATTMASHVRCACSKRVRVAQRKELVSYGTLARNYWN